MLKLLFRFVGCGWFFEGLYNKMNVWVDLQGWSLACLWTIESSHIFYRCPFLWHGAQCYQFFWVDCMWKKMNSMNSQNEWQMRNKTIDSFFMIDWLIDWLVGWLVGWLNDWSIDWINEWISEWVHACMNLMDGWMNGWMNEWMNGWMDEWMNGWMDEWMNGWMDEWMNGWMDEWMKGWMDEWTNGWMDEWMNGWMDEWMNGWMDDWMIGWMDEWMGGSVGGWVDGGWVNEWMKKWMNETFFSTFKMVIYVGFCQLCFLQSLSTIICIKYCTCCAVICPPQQQALQWWLWKFRWYRVVCVERF